jgi:hypothetical protein
MQLVPYTRKLLCKKVDLMVMPAWTDRLSLDSVDSRRTEGPGATRSRAALPFFKISELFIVVDCVNRELRVLVYPM